MADAVAVTEELLRQPRPAGVYHCVNSGSTTWADLAEEAARCLHVEPRLVRVSVADVVLRAARPQFAALSNARLAGLGMTLPTWQNALARYVAVRQTLAARGAP